MEDARCAGNADGVEDELFRLVAVNDAVVEVAGGEGGYAVVVILDAYGGVIAVAGAVA